jgi:arylsulfatase A-like enzyme
MQGNSLVAAESRGLPPGKILPQYLKDLGYTTRAVGKWHLGFYKPEVTPTYRGFDSHLGYWNDYVSYYDYILQERVNMLDLRFSQRSL